MTDTWLAPAEVEELTAKTRWTAQCRALARMGVPFTPNAAGRPLIERAVVLTSTQAKHKTPKEPNWGAVRGAQKAA